MICQLAPAGCTSVMHLLDTIISLVRSKSTFQFYALSNQSQIDLPILRAQIARQAIKVIQETIFVCRRHPFTDK